MIYKDVQRMEVSLKKNELKFSWNCTATIPFCPNENESMSF